MDCECTSDGSEVEDGVSYSSMSHRSHNLLLLAIVVALVSSSSCRRQEVRSELDRTTSSVPTRCAAVEKIVAIGDLHGDLDATLSALRLAGAIDERSRWVGGKLVLVQTGDQLDRGDGERAILDLFEKLTREAENAGGAFHVLNGNHEVMNVMGDLRYVTPGGFRDFSSVPGLDLSSRALRKIPVNQRPRAAAFRPGGPYAMMLAKRNTVVIVGENVFAHGGVLPEHVDYGVERLNREVRIWMGGERRRPPRAAAGKNGVVWTREYSDLPDAQDCAALGIALQKLGAKRMIVAHTVQKNGISPACDERVWRIDVGMAKHYGGRPAVLEIKGSVVKVLRDSP